MFLFLLKLVLSSTWSTSDDYKVMYTDTDSMWIAFTKKNPFGLPKELPDTPDQIVPSIRPSLCKPYLMQQFARDKQNYMVCVTTTNAPQVY